MWSDRGGILMTKRLLKDLMSMMNGDGYLKDSGWKVRDSDQESTLVMKKLIAGIRFVEAFQGIRKSEDRLKEGSAGTLHEIYPASAPWHNWTWRAWRVWIGRGRCCVKDQLHAYLRLRARYPYFLLVLQGLCPGERFEDIERFYGYSASRMIKTNFWYKKSSLRTYSQCKTMVFARWHAWYPSMPPNNAWMHWELPSKQREKQLMFNATSRWSKHGGQKGQE